MAPRKYLQTGGPRVIYS